MTNLGDGACGFNQGTGTLRQAIVDANWDATVLGDPSSTITFNPMMAGTISLCAPLPSLIANITIKGTGVTVTNGSGQGIPYIFCTDGGDCEIDNLAITNPGGSGIGVNSGDILTLNDCSVTNCTSGQDGGGIANDGRLNMYNCDVEANTATFWSGGGIYNTGTLNCNQCSIDNNRAFSGGGIYTTGPGNVVNLLDGSVGSNTAFTNGGGIYNNGGTVSVIGPMNGPTMMSLDLSYNTAGSAGGGLYQDGSGASTFFYGAGIVSNSVTSGMGGGLCLNGGTAQLTNYSFLAGNSAANGSAIAYQAAAAGWSKDLTSTVTGTIYAY